ncbi:MAG TPA: cytochrome c oxidase subunit II [Gammaproteobacteria bacterium]
MRYGLILSALAAVPAHADEPLAYLTTAGPAADPLTHLGWLMGGVSIAVIVIVALLLVWALARRRPGGEAGRTLQRDRGGLSFIYIGVGATVVVLGVCMGWNLAAIAKVRRPPRPAAFTVQVTAHQWWWEVEYPDGADPHRDFLTANEIHIPAGEPVRLELRSPDVIHSFWVPKLAGKMDVIPGQINVAWMQADRPGVYRGECSVLCGAQHAHMAFQVIADTPDGFKAWKESQLADAAPPAGIRLERGERVFDDKCAGCHTIRGGNAGGVVGPDLTHLMSRRTLAAGTLPNDPEHLKDWVSAPQRFKPGTQMPTVQLSAGELSELAAYLQTLH